MQNISTSHTRIRLHAPTQSPWVAPTKSFFFNLIIFSAASTSKPPASTSKPPECVFCQTVVVYSKCNDNFEIETFDLFEEDSNKYSIYKSKDEKYQLKYDNNNQVHFYR